jgi:hypothetical protein
MSDLDPRALKVQNIAKYAGASAIVAVGSLAVIASGGLVVVAGVAMVAGLATINFLPVAARSLALWKQKSLISLAEAFSEETILEDEKKEYDRIKILEQQFKLSSAELEGSIEELNKQLVGASEVEREAIKAQVQAMKSVIQDAEDTLITRKKDLEELTRVNKLYIALHRSATALEKAQGAERDSQEIQNIELARNSIKARMRAALAGQKIEQINRSSNKKLETPTVIRS